MIMCRNVARGFEWRDDEAATVVWCMPLDSGLIKTKVDYHDAVFALELLHSLDNRKNFSKHKCVIAVLAWGNSTIALVNEGLTGKQLNTE